jgi:uroporphyrin-III C-methyltransferase / precorrin-2 dehydrogenase / sirohydrochlorin ferrochelatase
VASLFPLAPVFMDLAGRSVVLLSGTAALAPLADMCVQSGAGVTAIDQQPSAAIAAIAGLRLVHRRWRAADVKGAALVIAHPADTRPVRARAAAKAARAVFYAPGAPDLSDLATAQTLVTGPLVIGLGHAGLPTPLEAVVWDRLRTAMAPMSGFLTAAVQQRAAIEARLAPVDIPGFWRSAAAAALALESSESPPDWGVWLRQRLDAPVKADGG